MKSFPTAPTQCIAEVNVRSMPRHIFFMYRMQKILSVHCDFYNAVQFIAIPSEANASRCSNLRESAPVIVSSTKVLPNLSLSASGIVIRNQLYHAQGTCGVKV